MPASRRTPYHSGSSPSRGRDGSRGDGNTKGLSPRGCRSRIRRAGELSGTRRGPVLESARTSPSAPTSEWRRRRISPLRHPVSRRSRMMSACCTFPFPVSASSTRCRRAISSRERKRVSFGRRLGGMPRVGLFSIYPRAIAKFMIWRRSRSPMFAPPGAPRLQASNHRLTSSGAMRFSGLFPNAGSRRAPIRVRTPFFVDGL